jgi:enolase-phosphatase E1
MKAIIVDIEGTTTDINFVHKVLFPYSKSKMEYFVKDNASFPLVDEIIKVLRKDFLSSGSSLDDIVSLLKYWIETDQKKTPLKTLQGLIWEKGYKEGDFKGHLYEDVPAKLKEWKEAGVDLYIYSSGSAYAQKLLFGHTDYGDLNPLFSGNFDTSIGGKKEALSYEKILLKLKLAGDEVLFLSDSKEELDAAKENKILTFHLNRDDLYKTSKHPLAKNFNEIKIK